MSRGCVSVNDLYSQFAAASALVLSRDIWTPVDGMLRTVWRPRPQACDRVRRIPSTGSAVTVTICGDACPLSCVSAEAYKLAQCMRPQGWES